MLSIRRRTLSFDAMNDQRQAGRGPIGQAVDAERYERIELLCNYAKAAVVGEGPSCERLHNNIDRFVPAVPTRPRAGPTHSLRLNTPGLYDFRPLFELALQESTQLFGSHVDRDRPRPGELLLYFRALFYSPHGC